MGHEAALTPTTAVAKRVREVRKRRGLTAQQLADKMVEQGIAWQRSTVAKLENGNRENVTLSEFLALAVVLNVAPVHLLVPPDTPDAPFAVTPAKTESGKDVRRWVRGFWSLGASMRDFLAEAEEQDLPKEWQQLAGMIEDYLTNPPPGVTITPPEGGARGES